MERIINVKEGFVWNLYLFLNDGGEIDKIDDSFWCHLAPIPASKPTKDDEMIL
jgi:hypothetical protein